MVNFFHKTDNLTDSQLAHAYSQSLATLCLSFAEPFGLVALESMACGTPVIAVNEGGYTETVINEKTGFLIQRNAHELIAKVDFLLQNSVSRKKMGKLGRETIEKHWTWEKHGERLEKCIK
jgi:glycosyltransferase involved in cell wall biosynthesis